MSYISCTCTMRIKYGTSDVPLEGVNDYDFAMMPRARSTNGLLFTMYGGRVS